MTKRDLIFIERLWNRMTETAFEPIKLIRLLRRLGGHDMTGLDEDHMLRLFDETPHVDWTKIGFSFSELLACYCVPDQHQTREAVVGWVFASFVISDAIKQNVTDWEMQLNLLINGFLQVKDKLEIWEAIEILRRIFS